MILVFDQDGTLYSRRSSLFFELRRRTLEWLEARLDLTRSEVLELYSALPERYPHPYDGFASLGLSVDDYHRAVFEAAVPEAHLSPDGRLRALLRALGVPVHVVTLASRGYSERVQAALGIADLVDEIWSMSALGGQHHKEAAYRLIARDHGVELSDLWVVGDDFTIDILPALRLGCRAFLIGEAPRPGVVTLRRAIDLEEHLAPGTRRDP